MWNDCAIIKDNQQTLITTFIMSNSAAQFVSLNFAEFLLENANNGNEILAVLDDLYEVQSTPLSVIQIKHKLGVSFC